MSINILIGDARERLATLPDESVHCCVTSPPYFGLRSYLPDGHEDKHLEIGLEPSPDVYIDTMVSVFREVRRVLRDDGTLWLNIGDSYASSPPGNKTVGVSAKSGLHGVNGASGVYRETLAAGHATKRDTSKISGIKPKDLIGIPWLLAFALRADGWWLRQDIIWCLSGGAWVYARTQKGDMPVMVKDLVRLDPRTVKLWNGEKWTQVLGWGPTPDATERFELVLRSGERIGCTGGHVWPTQRGNIAARDLAAGDVIATCRLPEPANREWPQYLSAGGLWLSGLYLAEGSKSNGALCFALSKDELPWAERIRAIAEHYGGSSSYTVKDGNLSVRVWGRVIHALVDSYIGGSAAIDKHLKVAAWRLPNEALRHLIEGYLDGDGHDDKPNGRWRLGFCRNYALERDLRTAAARLGATLTLNPGIAAYQGGEQPNFRGEWRWERSGHWNEKDRGEVVAIRNSRARGFWDIGVEDEPHLFALASGVLTHNSKPNPMPESVTDRCTKAHEYLFLLAKSERYYFDADAIKEASITEDPRRPYTSNGAWELDGRPPEQRHGGKPRTAGNKTHKYVEAVADVPWLSRNKRSVWTVATAPYSEAHFATFPPALIEPCILAGCPKSGTVLDPFGGAGTTALVADRLGRNTILIELNPAYAEMARRRIEGDAGLFAEVAAG